MKDDNLKKEEAKIQVQPAKIEALVSTISQRFSKNEYSMDAESLYRFWIDRELSDYDLWQFAKIAEVNSCEDRIEVLKDFYRFKLSEGHEF